MAIGNTFFPRVLIYFKFIYTLKEMEKNYPQLAESFLKKIRVDNHTLVRTNLSNSRDGSGSSRVRRRVWDRAVNKRGIKH